MLAGRVPEVAVPSDVVPVNYLPGVSRATLRATEECPPELKALAELQYRGVFWSQLNAKDWTIGAFLQAAKGGLGLSLAKDAATTASLKRALERLVDVPVTELASKAAVAPLDSEFFFTSVVGTTICRTERNSASSSLKITTTCSPCSSGC